MRLLNFILRLCAETLKGLLFRWILTLFAVLGAILAALLRSFRRLQLPHVEKSAVGRGCAAVSHPAFQRPDPLIYSQPYLLSLGLPVTWDNPDIVLWRGGAIAPEGQLLPDTDYEIDATIWNNSFNAPAVGVVVEFSYLTFGVATVSTPIGSRVVNLGVKGGANHPAHARVGWRTPPAGHYCIQVQLKWASDLNPANNLGQNNVDVQAAASPASFKFQLRNDSNLRRTYVFETDSYVLPQRADCGKRLTKSRNKSQRWRAVQSAHRRENFPMPAGWTADIAPSQVALGPGEASDIDVIVTPPDGWTGRQAVNVSALYDKGAYAGGVTLHVTRP